MSASTASLVQPSTAHQGSGREQLGACWLAEDQSGEPTRQIRDDE